MLSNLIKGSINAVYGYTEETISMLVGVISDTHGCMNPKALSLLQGVDHILHAGDIGRIDIIQELQNIAPLTPVRGNVDR
jgi:predicted phosphodiesterase